jgi:transcriptional regulator with XRE-family HTH domain
MATALTPLRTLEEVGRAIRALRLAQNRTQRDLCAATGLSLRALSALESGAASDVRLQTLLKVLRYFRRQVMLAPESTLPTLDQLDFERDLARRGPQESTPSAPPERARARTPRRRRAPE